MISQQSLTKIIKYLFGKIEWAAFFIFSIWFAFDTLTGRSNWSILELIIVPFLIFSQAYAVLIAFNWGAKVFLYKYFVSNWRPRIRDYATMVPICFRTFRSIFIFIVGCPLFLGIYLLRYRWVGFEVGLICFFFAAIAYSLFEIWPPYAMVLGTSSDETTELFFTTYSGLYPLKVIACVDTSGSTPVVLLRYMYRSSGRCWKKQVEALLSVCWVTILDGRCYSEAVSYEIMLLSQMRCYLIIVTKDDGTCPALMETDKSRLRSKKVEFVTYSELKSKLPNL